MRIQRGALTAFVARHYRAWNLVMSLCAIVYVVVAILNDDAPGAAPPLVLLALSALFLTEFTLRCWDAPSRLVYLRGHWLDLVSCIPLVGGLRAIRLLRLLRLGAALRILSTVELEMRSRARSRESLWFVVPVLVLLWVGSAYGMWVLEHDQNAHVKTFLDALYWSFITVTTVGYGDVAPVTAEGRILSGMLVFVGIGLLGFVSARLTALWLQHDGGARDDHVAHQLDALRLEVAELRLLLLAQQGAHHNAVGCSDRAERDSRIESNEWIDAPG